MSKRRWRRRHRKATAAQFPFVWTRDKLPAGRKGQPCRITRNGKVGGVVHVIFSDGQGFSVERKYLEHRG